MIEFRLLGGVDLRREDGVEVRSVLAQPRRVALLAYLALRGAEGMVRRDTLLGIFWPESDASRARGALRNALHFLRRSLGADAIEARGDEELRTCPERIRCDAVEFGRLLDEGRPEEALELYRGELLEGFFTSGAPEFERWVDGARASLRRRAVAATVELADGAESEGRVRLAVRYARRGVTLAPDDETCHLRLARLLWKAGDRAGGLAAFDALRARLAEHGLEPSADAIAWLRETRRQESGAPGAAVPSSLEVAEEAAKPTPERGGGRDGAADGAGTPGMRGLRAGRERRRAWIRPAAVAALGLVLLAAAAGAFRAALAPEPAVSDELVAVFPFGFRGGDELAFLDEGLMDLLSSSLDGAGDLRAMDPRALLSYVDRRGDRPRDPAAAGALSRSLGAGWFVLGDAVEMEGRLRITAAVYDARTARPQRDAAASVEGQPTDAFGLAERLAARLLEEWRVSEVPGLRPRSTGSVDALKAYLRGEARYRAGRYRDAFEAFGRAAEFDPTFALARYRLSNAAIWVGRDQLALREAARARELATGLAREDSLLIVAWHELRTGNVGAAEALYEHVTELRPDYLDAWTQLGEIRFHWGPSFGVPSSEAAYAFERVLDFDGGDVSALLHLLRLSAQEGRVGRVDSLAERLMERNPEGPWSIEVEAVRAVLSGDALRRERALRTAALAGDGVAQNVGMSVAAFTQDLEAALWLSRATASPGRSAEARSKATLVQAELTAALGRWREAMRALERSRDLPPARALEFRAMLATLPFVPVPDAELVGLRRALTRPAEPPIPGKDDPARLGEGSFPPVSWEGIFEPRRLYLLGSLAARLGAVSDALEAASELDRLGREGRPPAPYLARLIRARVAVLQGDPERAARALGAPAMPAIPTYETLTEYPRGYERFLRAELAAALGRPREALRWYATFPTPTAANLPYLAPALAARARIHEARGERDAAASLYDRFLALWTDADPELQPEVRAARERRSRL